MALDESLYDSLKETYYTIESYLGTATLTREHSELIMRNEELSALLERLDIEAIEEQTKEIEALHAKLGELRVVSDSIRQEIITSGETSALLQSVVVKLDEIFSELNPLIV
ncbi:MAG: hypothetical protein JXQ67_06050 [Campylobacterales bacterium]|nr:hypothetical protein [Campylobacterales bacterium]